MTQFVCVSTTFHLLVAHALTSVTDADWHAQRELLVWRPMQRTEPIVLGSLDPYHRLIDPDGWSAVHDLEQAGWAYDLHRLSGVAGPRQLVSNLRAMRVTEAALDGILGDLGPGDEVVVTNPTAGAIDRFVALRARAAGARVCFLEDGVGAYLGASLKQAIDEGYWAEPSSSALGDWLSRRWRSTLLRAGSIEAEAVDLAAVGFEAGFVFDDLYVLGDAAPVNVGHRGRRLLLDIEAIRAVLDRCAARLSWPTRRYEALYLSRPDSEDGLLSEGDEIDLVAGILRDLADFHAGNIALKPHPRDRVRKVRSISDASGVPLVEDDVLALPAEVVAHALEPAACYGTWSGSLLYVSLLSGIDTYSVLPVMLTELAAPGEHLAALWTQLETLFAPHVRAWERNQ